MNSILEYLNNELHNSNISPTLINIRLFTLTIDRKLGINNLQKNFTWLKVIT